MGKGEAGTHWIGEGLGCDAALGVVGKGTSYIVTSSSCCIHCTAFTVPAALFEQHAVNFNSLVCDSIFPLIA
jgi:hypothetical protein